VWKAPVAGSHSYVYDPSQPTPSRGGGLTGDPGGGSVDRAPSRHGATCSVQPRPAADAPVHRRRTVAVTCRCSRREGLPTSGQAVDRVSRMATAITSRTTRSGCDIRDGFDKKQKKKRGRVFFFFCTDDSRAVYKITLTNMVTAAEVRQGHRSVSRSRSATSFDGAHINNGGNTTTTRTTGCGERTSSTSGGGQRRRSCCR